MAGSNTNKRERMSFDATKVAREFAASFSGDIDDIEDIASITAWGKGVRPAAIARLRDLVREYFDEDDDDRNPVNAEQAKFIMDVLFDVEAMCALTSWMASCNTEYAWRLDDILDLTDGDSNKARTILNKDVGHVPDGWERLLYSAFKHIANN